MKLFFRKTGNGKPVVILHGFLGVSDNWVTFGRQMAGDFEVFIPDLRNHGQSPHDSRMDYNVLVEDLHEFILDHKLDDVNLIGHSLGGKIAMWFSLKYPGLLAKLVIVDIATREYPPDIQHLQLIQAMKECDLVNARSRSDVETQLKRNVPDQRLRQFLLKNVWWKDPETLKWRLNLDVLQESITAVREKTPDYPAFTKPVLLIRGGQSQYVRDSDLEGILALFPSAIVKTIASASHWVHADAPVEFYRIVHDFLLN